MKVLLQGRVNLFEKKGGDTNQILKYNEHLSKLDVNVDITTELEPNLKNYDLVHLFNTSPRIHETYVHALNAKKQKKPIVLSPIYVNPAEIEYYDQKHRFGILKVLNKVDLSTRETIKNIFRCVKDKRQTKAVYKQVLTGYRNAQEKVLKLSDLWLVLAQSEASQIKKDFDIDDKKYIVIPNGMDQKFFTGNAEKFYNEYKIRDFVLTAGRIETLKNQLSVIKAISQTNLKLVIVGAVNPLHKNYFDIIKKEIDKNKNITYIAQLPYEEMPNIFAAAKVHVLASWYEVTPMVDFEAGAAGCNIVTTTKGYNKEYLKDMVWYCDPDDIDSIKNSMLAAWQTPKNENLKNYVKQFSWENTAQKIYQAYQNVLKND